jgi:hypothetical protein
MLVVVKSERMRVKYNERDGQNDDLIATLVMEKYV